MAMKLSEPLLITPRLMPGVRIGDAFISIEYSRRPGRGGRMRYRYYIDAPGFEHTDDDLQSGAQGGSLVDGLKSLLSFLSACAESRRYGRAHGIQGENADLFPDPIGEWAEANQDEIDMMGFAIDEESLEIDED